MHHLFVHCDTLRYKKVAVVVPVTSVEVEVQMQKRELTIVREIFSSITNSQSSNRIVKLIKKLVLSKEQKKLKLKIKKNTDCGIG